MSTEQEDKLAELLSVYELIREKLQKLELAEHHLHELAMAIRVVRKRVGQMILEEQREKGGAHEALPETTSTSKGDRI